MGQNGTEYYDLTAYTLFKGLTEIIVVFLGFCPINRLKCSKIGAFCKMERKTGMKKEFLQTMSDEHVKSVRKRVYVGLTWIK